MAEKKDKVSFTTANLLNILQKKVTNDTLKNADEALANAEFKLKGELDEKEESAIIKLNKALNALQIATIDSKKNTKNIKDFVEKMTKKITNLTNIINPEKKEQALQVPTNLPQSQSEEEGKGPAAQVQSTQEKKPQSKLKIMGGSISTNNSIRRQIFTDLKYITKYLKYKTKYIVFKSKHQFN